MTISRSFTTHQHAKDTQAVKQKHAPFTETQLKRSSSVCEKNTDSLRCEVIDINPVSNRSSKARVRVLESFYTDDTRERRGAHAHILHPPQQ